MQSLQTRFESKFQRGRDAECWMWTAGKCSDGYGTFQVLDKTVGAHRVAYELYVGEIPKRLHVLHTCDNPACVNPMHLWVGTHADNMRDRSAKGRHSVGDRKGEKHPMAKLTAEQAKAIREDKRTYEEIASAFGTSFSNVRNIKSMVSWRHI